MAFFLDCAVVVILIVTCIVGYAKGFVKYLVGMIATAAAAGVAIWGSGTLAEPVYVRYFEKPVNERLQTAIENFDIGATVRQALANQGVSVDLSDEEIKRAVTAGGDIATNIGGMLKDKGADNESVQRAGDSVNSYLSVNITDDINEELEKTGLSKYVDKVELTRDELQGCIKKAASDNKAEAAAYISEKTVKPLVVGILRAVLFLGCFIIVSLLFKLIIFISGVLNAVPELKAADRFGGLALGALKGILYCALMGFILSAFVNATKDSMAIFNSAIGDSTYVFKYFFDFFYK